MARVHFQEENDNWIDFKQASGICIKETDGIIFASYIFQRRNVIILEVTTKCKH